MIFEANLSDGSSFIKNDSGVYWHTRPYGLTGKCNAKGIVIIPFPAPIEKKQQKYMQFDFYFDYNSGASGWNFHLSETFADGWGATEVHSYGKGFHVAANLLFLVPNLS